MTKYETLDRLLAGEPVEPTEDLVALAMLAEEVEAIFTAAEPTKSASRRGLNTSLEAFREAAPASHRPARTRRVATRVLVAAAMLVSLPAVAWAASEGSLPGDTMYPVKRAFEEIRLVLAGSPVDEAVVLLDQAAERLGEAARATGLGRDEASSLAVAGYVEAMDQVGLRIAEARSQGIDVSAIVAMTRGLAERHEALLDALLGSGPTPGSEPAVETVPPAGGGSAGGTEPDEAREPGQDRASGGKDAADGKRKGQNGKNKGKNKNNGGKGGDAQQGGAGETETDVSGSQDPPSSGPGKSGGAPYGKAKGHEKHGPPPHGRAKGHEKHGPPPRAQMP